MDGSESVRDDVAPLSGERAREEERARGRDVRGARGHTSSASPPKPGSPPPALGESAKGSSHAS